MKEPSRLFDFPHYQLKHYPLEVMMTSRVAGEWKSYSTSQFVDEMNKISRALLASGLNPGDKVALITHTNCCEWNIMDCGIMQMGGIDVPIYHTMSESDFTYILNHSESKLCFVSSVDLYNKVMSVKPDCPGLTEVFCFEKSADIPHWKEFQSRSENVPYSKVIEISEKVKDHELATIIYTSGTTGQPKGVMLSHKNIASNAVDSEDRLPLLEKQKSRTLSFLPCCHIFERMLHYLYMHNAVTMYLTGMDAIKDDLLVAKPHIFTGVPRLFEKFYDGIYAKGMSNTGIKKWLFKQAHDLAIRWEPDAANGAWYEFRLNLARKVVFSKVKAALGLTEIGAIASGSAALQPRLARFFCGAGIPLKEGYGLTETSPVIAVNTFRRPGMWRAGSVGMPIRNVEVKIAEDGEILCKGPNVMMGYYKEPDKTHEVLKDGWFHTGDIGEVRDGFLVITDRKKEIFKTSGGKYIAPQMLENLLKESVYIEQVMIVGENQNFPGALIVPDFLVLKPWAEKRGLKASTLAEVSAHREVRDLIAADIEKMNAKIGKWEQVKAFRLLPQPYTVEGGELTPTLKLKRKNILAKYGELVKEIYSA